MARLCVGCSRGEKWACIKQSTIGSQEGFSFASWRSPKPSDTQRPPAPESEPDVGGGGGGGGRAKGKGEGEGGCCCVGLLDAPEAGGKLADTRARLADCPRLFVGAATCVSVLRPASRAEPSRAKPSQAKLSG